MKCVAFLTRSTEPTSAHLEMSQQPHTFAFSSLRIICSQVSISEWLTAADTIPGKSLPFVAERRSDAFPRT